VNELCVGCSVQLEKRGDNEATGAWSRWVWTTCSTQGGKQN
jgi:hypothetical protein